MPCGPQRLSLRAKMTKVLSWVILAAVSLLDGATNWTEAYGNHRPAPTNHVHEYVEKGTLNIGAVFSIHDYSDTQACGKNLRETGVVQYVEAIVYAISKVNNNRNLLPGIDLGFVILDDCSKAETALERALHLMPIHRGRVLSRECGERTDRNDVDFAFYDVVGVVGPESSPASIQMANILGMFHIPQISPTASSDLLSDKKRFPYFMRMVPPDRYQVRAILEIILHFRWAYLSIVYSKGGYGEEAQKHFEKLAKQHAICISGRYPVSQGDTEELFARVVQDLDQTRANVVVLFTDQEETRGILKAVMNAKLLGRFVWVGSDGVGYNMNDFDGLEEAAVGSLSIKAYSQRVPAFDDYFQSLSPGQTRNPWFHKMWSAIFNCSWSPQNDSVPCRDNASIAYFPDYDPEDAVSIIIDTVYIFAHALDSYIRDICPDARFQSRDDIHGCLEGDLYLKYLRNTTIVGHNGQLTFDENGDARGKYEVVNFQRAPGGGYKTKRVAIWDVQNPSKLQINNSEIRWYSEANTNDSGAPESTCGEGCDLGEIYSYFRDTCCWECRPCNKNEITVLNATKCSTCPMFMWPDQQNFSVCYSLEPHHMTWSDPAVIVLTSLAVVGISYCTVVFCLFVRNNNARLIKATSRELSYVMLGGATMQFILIFTVLSRPTDFVCLFNTVGFNVSFAVVYAPLLTRTNRIYRIFNAGKRTKVLPSFTSSFSQIVIALTLIMVQVGEN